MTATRLAAIALLSTGLLSACQDAGERSITTLAPGSAYTVPRIDGVPAPEGVTFEVGEDGRVFGAAPCNRFTGQLTQKGGVMTISGVAMTRMACTDNTRSAAETRFNTALGLVTGASRSEDRATIALTDAEGRERILLQPK